MLIIADSSALIALSSCDGLHLLDNLFAEIRVPQDVYDEVVIVGKAESLALQRFLHGRVLQVATSQFVINAGGLGKGELAAMALYKQIQADYLLIDDRRARTIAEANQMQCIGSLWVLLEAKKQGIIPAVAPYVASLKDSEVLYFGATLLQKVLDLAGEKDK